MRTRASDEDGAAAGYVVDQLWTAWEEMCAPGVKPTVSAFAREAGVEAETLRVLVRSAEQASLRSGPGFLTVARLASCVNLDLNRLARESMSARSGK